MSSLMLFLLPQDVKHGFRNVVSSFLCDVADCFMTHILHIIISDLGPYSQNILRLKVAPNSPIKEKILKIVWACQS